MAIVKKERKREQRGATGSGKEEMSGGKRIGPKREGHGRNERRGAEGNSW